MRQPGYGLGAAAIVAALCFSPIARGGETKLSVEQVPKPVMDAVQRRFTGAKVTEAAKETEEGRLVYEVTFQEDGRSVDATFTSTGELLTIEKTIPESALPRPVAEALAKKYPGARHRTIEAVTEVEEGREKLVYYELVVVPKGKPALEVEITPDGASITEDAQD